MPEHARRLSAAVQLYWFRRGKSSLAVLGQLIAEAEGREPPYSQPTVSAWLAGRNQPSFDTVRAIAAVLGGDPEWYAFGRGTPPPFPRNWTGDFGDDEPISDVSPDDVEINPDPDLLERPRRIRRRAG